VQLDMAGALLIGQHLRHRRIRRQQGRLERVQRGREVDHRLQYGEHLCRTREPRVDAG
jgi:hypothetical protein